MKKEVCQTCCRSHRLLPWRAEDDRLWWEEGRVFCTLHFTSDEQGNVIPWPTLETQRPRDPVTGEVPWASGRPPPWCMYPTEHVVLSQV